MGYSGKSFRFSEFRDDPRFWHARTVHTNIRGITKTNPDGTERQEIIRKWCGSGDALYLARERNNPAHPNAIRVFRVVCPDGPDNPHVGEQLGYVSHELADDLAPDMDERGFILLAKILNVTGGEDGRNLGVNIQIEAYRPALLGPVIVRLSV
jgi:hypothetical protein